MQKLSQTEELARSLAARARHHMLTPEQISRAMDEADYDVAQLDELYAALEQRGVQLAEESPELPALDDAQIGKLEHELSAEGVAPGAAADGAAGDGAGQGSAGRGCRCPPCPE